MLLARRYRHTKALAWVAALVLILLAEVAFIRSQGIRSNDVDEGVYAYVGWSWSEGYWPYRDSWARHGPMVFVAKLVLTSAFGTMPETLGVQALVIGSIAALLVAGVARVMWGGLAPSLVLALCVLLWTQKGPESGIMATPGSLIGVFTTGAILAALYSARSTRWRSSALLAFVAGLMAGLALSTKPNAIAGGILGAAIIWFFTSRHRIADRLRLVALVALGALSPVALFAWLFGLAGALDALIECYVKFNSMHSAVMIGEVGPRALLGRLRNSLSYVGLFRLIVAVSLVYVSAAIWTRVYRRRDAAVLTRQDLIVPAWLLLELVLLASNGGWPYHSFPILLPLALGSTWIAVVASRVSRISGHGRPVIVTSVSLIAAGLLLAPPAVATASLSPPSSAQRQMADWNRMVRSVEEVTPPGGKLFLLTWDAPVIMNITHRRAASRYQSIEPLITLGYTSNGRWAEYLRSLQDSEPEVILVTRWVDELPLSVSALMDRSLTWYAGISAANGDDTEYPARREFKDFIAQHYTIESCIHVDTMCLFRNIK